MEWIGQAYSQTESIAKKQWWINCGFEGGMGANPGMYISKSNREYVEKGASLHHKRGMAN